MAENQLFSSRDELSHLLASEIEEFYGSQYLGYKGAEEEVYILYKFFFGFFCKKLHVYFFSGKLIGYKLRIYLLGLCIM